MRSAVREEGGGAVAEESDVIGDSEGASERPGDPTRSALKADRWQISILPHPHRGEPEDGAERPGHAQDTEVNESKSDMTGRTSVCGF